MRVAPAREERPALASGVLGLIVAGALIGCPASGPAPAPVVPPPPPPPAAAATPIPAPPAAAAGPTAGQRLTGLASAFWDARLRADPVEATVLGFRKYDGLMPDVTPGGKRRRTAELEALLRGVQGLPAASLKEPEQVTLKALLAELRGDLDLLDCDLDAWSVDPRSGPQVTLLSLPRLQPVRTLAEGQALLARWRAVGPHLDTRTANLRASLAAGRVATRDDVTRVLRQLDSLLAQPVARWPLMQPAKDPHADWAPADLQAYRQGITTAVSEGIRPALQRHRQLLRKEVLPRARPDDMVGLLHVPGGPACYRKLVRLHTSLELPPEEIHRYGLAELARIRAELEALGKKALGTRDLASLQRRLRNDRRLFFTGRDEIEASARAALARAAAQVPRWFGRVPATACEVKRIEPHEEKDTTIAYYRQPAVDGSRPGRYYVNTYAPPTRPRYEAQVLAYHEAVPGHHTQIAIGQELTSLPEFRKHSGSTAFVEGWALYIERLADEMGLYSGDLDRLGMLSFDAWRASRLVVDTGMHVHGWSRQRAISTMLDNSLLARNNVVNEVARYVGWPGQALAYKMGQREILRLRQRAQSALGAKFDIRGFHDVVLGQGALPLGVLAERVEAWIAAQPK